MHPLLLALASPLFRDKVAWPRRHPLPRASLDRHRSLVPP
jgi:hypothetical protein